MQPYVFSLALLLGGCLPPAMARPPVEQVVIVVVDGLRPDAIAAARAPNLQALIKAGPYSATARSVEQPETLPSFVTMVTSLPPSGHGVTWNDDRGVEYAGETLFTRVHAAKRRTALYYGKSKLTILAPRGSADRLWGPGPNKTHRERAASASIAARFAEDFARGPQPLSLVHLVEADVVGHDKGWMTPEYLEAVAVTDAGLGTVLGAIETSGRAGTTAVLLTADHGGEGDNHGVGRGETSWLVPFACRVPGRAPAAIAGPVTLMDLAPTALALLGLPPLPQAQGRAVEACLPR